MGMVVRSNLMAVNAQRQLGMNTSQVSKALEKLSSGYRINRAGDDASGLAISEKMKAQIRGLDAASLNSQDGISVVQTAEGALTEVHNMLNRMTELATRSANGINNEQNRQSLQDEVKELQDEIDRISKATNFNGINLLDGTMGGGGKSPKVEVNSANQPTMEENKASNATFTVSTTNLGAGNKFFNFKYKDAEGNDQNAEIEITTAANKDQFIQKFKDNTELSKLFDIKEEGGNIVITAKNKDVSIVEVKGHTATTNSGAQGTQLTGGKTEAAKDANTSLTMPGAGGLANNDTITIDGKTFTVAAADDAATGKFKDVTGLQKALDEAFGDGTYKVSGDYKNANDTLVIEKVSKDGTGLTLQIGDTAADFNQLTVSIDDMSTAGIGIDGIDISSLEGAQDAIDVIRAAIDQVSAQRATLGATQNRLEYTINNLDTASENIQAANSRIRDTDMAKMMMEYTKTNVITQSAQAMLAQANQQPQSILQLLQ